MESGWWLTSKATFGSPIVEERLHTEKRRVETGKVRSDGGGGRGGRPSAKLCAHPCRGGACADGREVDEVPPVREENGVTIVPVVREVLVVTKKLILTEEVRLKRSTSFEDHAQPVTLRMQRAVIERDELSGEQQP
jgi:stress response protein YsnF